MSSDEYRTESLETYRSSSEDAPHGSESDQFADLFPLSEVEKEIEDEHYDDFKPYVEMLVETGRQDLKPLQLTDCDSSQRPGMYLEILPKVIFETVETDAGIEEVDFPKPIFRSTIDQGTIASVEHTSSSAQTSRSKLLNSWCQYEPRLFSEQECANVLNSESFTSFLKPAEEGIFESLIQNKTADSFFSELKSLHGEEKEMETVKDSTIQMMGPFVCFEEEQKQIVTNISWNPVLKGEIFSEKIVREILKLQQQYVGKAIEFDPSLDIFIVSTLCVKKFEERILDSLKGQSDSYISYVWSCRNQFKPKIFLEYFDEIVLHEFNPTFPNVVIGGSFPGQLVLWNLTEAMLSEENYNFSEMNSVPSVLHHSTISNVDHIHTRGIKDFAWIPNHIEISVRGVVKPNPSKESYQIATFGSDGILKFWDLRAGYQNKPGFSISKMFHRLDGKWEPFHSVEMQLEEEKMSFSVTKFVFKESSAIKLGKKMPEDDSQKKKEQISTEFYAGCDDGKIFCGNFKLYRDDTGQFKSHPPQIFRSPHSGPISALLLSPFIDDIFLTTGARTICIWKHDIKETPIYSQDMHTYITSAVWSDTRPALFFLGYEDGSIEMWDLLHSIYEPFLIRFVATTSVTAMSMQLLTDEEHVLAAGDSEGTVYILSLPSYFWMPVENESETTKEFFEKQALLMQESLVPKASETSKAIKTEKRVYDTKNMFTDENLKKNYEEFLEVEKILLRHLGITTNEEKENLLEKE